MNNIRINFKTIGLLIVAIVAAAALSDAYNQVGLEVIYIIVPIGLIIGAAVYVERRFKKNK